MNATADNSFAGPGPEAVFQEGLAEGQFLIQKCDGCGAYVFYPRALCPDCGSPRLTVCEAGGGGTVYSTSVVRQSPKAGPDYNISVIELSEGPRMMSRVVDMDPAEVKIGMAVKAFVGAIGETPVVLFRKAEEGDA